jgi:hypothetical protein
MILYCTVLYRSAIDGSDLVPVVWLHHVESYPPQPTAAQRSNGRPNASDTDWSDTGADTTTFNGLMPYYCCSQCWFDHRLYFDRLSLWHIQSRFRRADRPFMPSGPNKFSYLCTYVLCCTYFLTTYITGYVMILSVCLSLHSPVTEDPAIMGQSVWHSSHS